MSSMIRALLVVTCLSTTACMGTIDEADPGELGASRKALIERYDEVGGDMALLGSDEVVAMEAFFADPYRATGSERVELATPGACAEATDAGYGETTYWCGATGNGCDWYVVPGWGIQIGISMYGDAAFICGIGGSDCVCLD
jgi:hypothetical protein